MVVSLKLSYSSTVTHILRRSKVFIIYFSSLTLLATSYHIWFTEVFNILLRIVCDFFVHNHKVKISMSLFKVLKFIEHDPVCRKST